MIFSWKIGGPAGYGIKSAGEIFAKTFLKKGYNIFYYSEYPSLIRGGHNTVQVDISDKIIRSSRAKIDFLVALDEKTTRMDKVYLKKGGILLYDGDLCQKKRIFARKNCYAVPMTTLAKEAGNEVTRNSVALGASLAFFEDGLEDLKETANAVFHKKEIGASNFKAMEKGYHYVRKRFVKSEEVKTSKSRENNHKKILLTGNEAMSLGALVGGCKFFSAYPMTPSSPILHYLALHQRETDMLVHQGEDEIGVITSALGASFAGARAMITTSGGGFALMNEALALSGMTETPLVIIEVMRPAPATGLPTWTEQGDLAFVLGAGHGDFPKVVLAPGDPKEAYEFVQHALNLAENYQLPVIVLSDKFLGESEYTLSPQDLAKVRIDIQRGELIRGGQLSNYKRYQNTKTGVSARAIPGVLGGEHIANSDEHNEYSFSVEGYNKDRKIQMAKRQRKIETLIKEIPAPQLYGPRKADLTVISWGSNKGPILDALEEIRYQVPLENQTVNYLHFNYLYPFPAKGRELLEKAQKFLLVENNQSGQFGKLLRQETGIDPQDKLLKFDGRPFWPEEIIDKIKKIKFKKRSRFLWKTKL